MSDYRITLCGRLSGLTLDALTNADYVGVDGPNTIVHADLGDNDQLREFLATLNDLGLTMVEMHAGE
ncbi:hypothetical protein ACLQ3C_07250 [Gordonia sp. DT30]|uniref:hypothetical protein n=1 Tax=unclassified Gordonia (in: high G+C Gram-positive bacteria) TaxID=2657482 RepID=UPI003CED49A8